MNPVFGCYYTFPFYWRPWFLKKDTEKTQIYLENSNYRGYNIFKHCVWVFDWKGRWINDRLDKNKDRKSLLKKWGKCQKNQAIFYDINITYTRIINSKTSEQSSNVQGEGVNEYILLLRFCPSLRKKLGTELAAQYLTNLQTFGQFWQFFSIKH